MEGPVRVTSSAGNTIVCMDFFVQIIVTPFTIYCCLADFRQKITNMEVQIHFLLTRISVDDFIKLKRTIQKRMVMLTGTQLQSLLSSLQKHFDSPDKLRKSLKPLIPLNEEYVQFYVNLK
jgi:hypothetical protein